MIALRKRLGDSALRDKKPRLVYPSYFAWVPIVIALWWGHASYGLPHVIWSYRFDLVGAGDRWDFAARRYRECRYIGPHGGFVTDAPGGRCAWIIWRRASDAGDGR